MTSGLRNWASTARLQFHTQPAGSDQMVTVSLSGAAPDSLKLELIHPTLERMDRQVHPEAQRLISTLVPCCAPIRDSMY